MDRTELTIVAAAALMVALGLGWVLRWVYSLLNPPPAPPPKADTEWAEYAKACEAQRDAAQARLAEVETELGNKLTQAHAELSAAMEGLGAARRATEHLEGRLATLDATRTSAAVAAPEAPAAPAAPPPEEPVASAQDTGTPEPDRAPAVEAPETAAETTVAQGGEPDHESDTGADVTEVEPAEIGAGVPDAQEPETHPDAEAPEAQPEEGAEDDSDAVAASPEDADAAPETTKAEGTGSKRKPTRRKSTKGGTGTTSRR